MINRWVLNRQKSVVGLIKSHACRWHTRCHRPRGNLGIPPATEAARKRLHASAAKATSVRTCFCINSGFGTPSTTMASPTVTPTAPSAAEPVAPTRCGRYLWRPQGRECVAVGYPGSNRPDYAVPYHVPPEGYTAVQYSPYGDPRDRSRRASCTTWYTALAPVAEGFASCCTVHLYRMVQSPLEGYIDLFLHIYGTSRFYSCLSQNPPPRFLLYQLVFPKRTQQPLYKRPIRLSIFRLPSHLLSKIRETRSWHLCHSCKKLGFILLPRIFGSVTFRSRDSKIANSAPLLRA